MGRSPASGSGAGHSGSTAARPDRGAIDWGIGCLLAALLLIGLLAWLLYSRLNPQRQETPEPAPTPAGVGELLREIEAARPGEAEQHVLDELESAELALARLQLEEVQAVAPEPWHALVAEQRQRIADLRLELDRLRRGADTARK